MRRRVWILVSLFLLGLFIVIFQPGYGVGSTVGIPLYQLLFIFLAIRYTALFLFPELMKKLLLDQVDAFMDVRNLFTQTGKKGLKMIGPLTTLASLILMGCLIGFLGAQGIALEDQTDSMLLCSALLLLVFLIQYLALLWFPKRTKKLLLDEIQFFVQLRGRLTRTGKK